MGRQRAGECFLCSVCAPRSVLNGRIELFVVSDDLDCMLNLTPLYVPSFIVSFYVDVFQVDARFARRLTIVGDIHGQLDDLLTIFELNGALRYRYFAFCDLWTLSCVPKRTRSFSVRVLHVDHIIHSSLY
jgi:hypothetical protein